jgi:hypothetical protein
MGVRGYSRAMRHGHLLLLALVAAAACSRGGPIDDDPVRPAGSGAAVPAAASAARLVPTFVDAAPPDAATATATAPALGLPPPASALHLPPPRIRDQGPALSSSGLPAEVVQRIVRQNFGRFRFCYESGLRLDPTLAGTVRVRFVVEPDGAVGAVSDAGSTLPDSGVVACIERGFGNLSFPVPAGGPLTVTYSLSLTPGEP